MIQHPLGGGPGGVQKKVFVKIGRPGECLLEDGKRRAVVLEIGRDLCRSVVGYTLFSAVAAFQLFFFFIAYTNAFYHYPNRLQSNQDPRP